MFAIEASDSDGEEGGSVGNFILVGTSVVAGMLSPRDAQLAEAFAVACEDQARGGLHSLIRSARSGDQNRTFGQRRF